MEFFLRQLSYKVGNVTFCTSLILQQIAGEDWRNKGPASYTYKRSLLALKLLWYCLHILNESGLVSWREEHWTSAPSLPLIKNCKCF